MIDCCKLARDGDLAARQALVKLLDPRIRKMATYYARRCGEDPDDLIQEAWVGLLEALPELDISIGSPHQYLIARARWRVLDVLKRTRVRRCIPLEEHPDSLLASSSKTPADALLVSDFISGLTALHMAILDCLLAGLTWREAGAALGCSSANITYHVRQIRRKYEQWKDEGCSTAPI